MKVAQRYLAGILVMSLAVFLPAVASASIPLGKRIGAGAFHALAIREDGTVLAWGGNGLGAFGNGGTVSSSVPTTGWAGTTTGRSVYGTYWGTSVIDTNGVLRTAGDNLWGTLGRPSIGNWDVNPFVVSLPAMAPPATVNNVGAGFQTQLAVMSNGQLWAWGNNEHGQYGNGAASGSGNFIPVRVGTDSDWRMVSAGRYHVAAVRQNGTLWTWGYNVDGQIGNGVAGADVLTPYQVGSDTDWSYVLCQADGTVAMKTNGTLHAWGRNNWGQLGLGHTTNPWPTPTLVLPPAAGTRWTILAVGAFHALATRDDGSLWAWGVGNRGQLGNGGTALSNPTPVAVSGGGGPWRQLAAGEDWSMALAADEWVWTWGHNQVGQLGVTSVPTGAGNISAVPVRVVNLHVAASTTADSAVAPVAPRLPNTGYPPTRSALPWQAAVLAAGVFAAAGALGRALRAKRER